MAKSGGINSPPVFHVTTTPLKQAENILLILPLSATGKALPAPLLPRPVPGGHYVVGGTAASHDHDRTGAVPPSHSPGSAPTKTCQRGNNIRVRPFLNFQLCLYNHDIEGFSEHMNLLNFFQTALRTKQMIIKKYCDVERLFVII